MEERFFTFIPQELARFLTQSFGGHVVPPNDAYTNWVFPEGATLATSDWHMSLEGEWYDGRETVALADGRQVTVHSYCHVGMPHGLCDVYVDGERVAQFRL